jgi:hypothetical protein
MRSMTEDVRTMPYKIILAFLGRLARRWPLGGVWPALSDEFANAIDDFPLRDCADFGALTRLIQQFELSGRQTGRTIDQCVLC